MAKKIRFPLEMAEGVEVRTLDELREHFSISQVLMYLENGKLDTWLRDRYEGELADSLAGLDVHDAGMAAKVCEIFEVEADLSAIESMEDIQERNRKIELLKEAGADEKYMDLVDQIAFTQDDLFDLLDDGQTTIYLCGENFSIPLGKEGVAYIGINHPKVKIASKVVVDWEEKRICLSNVQFDEAYQTIETPIVSTNCVLAYKLKETSCFCEKKDTGIILTLSNGETKTLDGIGNQILDSNDRYVVVCQKSGIISEQGPLYVLDLQSGEIVYSGDPKGECGNYGGLKIAGKWLVWDGKSLDIETGELIRFRMSQNHPGSATEVDECTVVGDKIVYRVAEHKSSASSSWAFNYYICDFAWENARQIFSVRKGSDGLFVKGLEYKNGMICSKYKVGFGKFCAEYHDIEFNFEDECEKSKTNITAVYK